MAALLGIVLPSTLALAPATAPPLLDPLTLIHNKAAQATALRAYSPPEKCGGLETATLAMG